MKMMKAAVALGMALTMTVTGASAVFAEGETLSVATDFESEKISEKHQRNFGDKEEKPLPSVN